MDPAVRNKLDGITLLLTVGVSLLSGLTFAEEPGNRVVVVALSFLAILGLLLVTSYLQPSPE